MKATATVYSPEGVDPFSNFTSRPARAKVRLFIQLLSAIIGGGILGRSLGAVNTRPSVVVGTKYATGTVTLATVSAADTVTINGVNLTAANGSPTAEQFDMSGTDAADATSFVNAVNVTSANALINPLVRASNMAGTITCASVAAEDYVDVAGVRFTAKGTASDPANEFSISGDDTADAAALVAKVNAHPATRDLVLASNAAGVVTIRQLPFGRWTSSALPLTSSTAVRLAVVAIAATAVVLLACRSKGTEGNAFTLASSDGTRLAVSAARLAGGTSSTLTF